MIAPNNGNGPLQGNGPSVMASSTGQGAFRHYLEDSDYLASLEAVQRIRAMEGYDQRRFYYTGQELDDLFDGEAGYFVDSRDGEARDEPEDVS